MERFIKDFGDGSGYLSPGIESMAGRLIPKMVYVGNLSFQTTEEQIYELFSRVGTIKKIIMGLHRKHLTPCGFCFVEYVSSTGALLARRTLHRSILDQRPLNIDFEANFVEGRQYGRGAQGGQICDERRIWRDSDRAHKLGGSQESQAAERQRLYGKPYVRQLGKGASRQKQSINDSTAKRQQKNTERNEAASGEQNE